MPNVDLNRCMILRGDQPVSRWAASTHHTSSAKSSNQITYQNNITKLRLYTISWECRAQWFVPPHFASWWMSWLLPQRRQNPTTHRNTNKPKFLKSRQILTVQEAIPRHQIGKQSITNKKKQIVSLSKNSEAFHTIPIQLKSCHSNLFLSFSIPKSIAVTQNCSNAKDNHHRFTKLYKYIKA